MGIVKEEKKVPIVSIQCDWDNTLMTPGNEVWASYKFRDCPSVHGKVTCISEDEGRLKYEASEGFSVKLVNQFALEVDLPQIRHRATLLAPTSSLSGIHSSAITCFDVTSKGMVVSTSTDGKLVLWNSDKEGRKVHLELEGHESEVYKCRFFPSEKVVLSCGSDMTLRIWCALTGRCPVKLVGHTQPITDCQIVEKGRNVISVSKDGSAKLWNCGSAECLGTVLTVSSIINCCLIHEAPPSMNLGMPSHNLDAKEVGTEKKILLVGCEDGTVHGAGLQTRQHLFSVPSSTAVSCLAFISETKFIVGYQDGKLNGYDLADGRPQPFLERHDSNSPVLCLLPTRDPGCRFYVSRGDGTVSLHAPTTSETTLYLTGSNCDPVYHMQSNSQYVFTSCRDRVLRLYDKTLTSKFIDS